MSFLGQICSRRLFAKARGRKNSSSNLPIVVMTRLCVKILLVIHTYPQLAELGSVILSTIGLVPDGVVIFLPSYAFLESVKASWTRSGLLGILADKKQVSPNWWRGRPLT